MILIILPCVGFLLLLVELQLNAGFIFKTQSRLALRSKRHIPLQSRAVPWKFHIPLACISYQRQTFHELHQNNIPSPGMQGIVDINTHTLIALPFSFYKYNAVQPTFLIPAFQLGLKCPVSDKQQRALLCNLVAFAILLARKIGR